MNAPSRVIVTIHGVSSENDTLNELAEDCIDEVPGLVHEPVPWQQHSPLLLKIGSVRESAFATVRFKLQDVCRRHPNDDLTIVAHSYGTLLLVRAIGTAIAGLNNAKIVTLGSIIARDHMWDGWLENGTIREVVNIARPFDRIVSRSSFLGGGYSGTRGFIKSAINCFKGGGHSSYYPDDVRDVQAVIQDAFEKGQHIRTHARWLAGLSFWQRVRYRALRLSFVLR